MMFYIYNVVLGRIHSYCQLRAGESNSGGGSKIWE